MPATTTRASSSAAVNEEGREASNRYDATRCEDEEAYKAGSTVGVDKGGRWHAAAFVAFGVYMCGSSMPWLPFQPTNKFDVAQVWFVKGGEEEKGRENGCVPPMGFDSGRALILSVKHAFNDSKNN